MKYLKKKLSEKLVREISARKKEPSWLLQKRLGSLASFMKSNLPEWGPSLSKINFEDTIYYAFSDNASTEDWSSVPDEIKTQFDELGIPQHEREALAGLSTQYESEVVYHRLKSKYENTGIIFETIEQGAIKYPKIFRKYFGKLVKDDENIFTALNGAVWSGGSFIYVPKDTHLDLPIETYFRINADKMGQFERTLIIADKGASVHYIEGCTAPQFIRSSLHSAVVEIYAEENSSVQYTTLQNWSKNVFNLVTKRSIAKKGASVKWLDVNIGSGVTMKYPTVILDGEGASGTVNSIALSENSQNIDSGSQMIHKAKNTKSLIKSTTISQNGGTSTFRGKVIIDKEATNSRSFISCDNVQLTEDSISNSYPVFTSENDSSIIEHEALASNISSDQLGYFYTRGISERKAREMILSGYFADFYEQLPLEYSIELERIIQLFNKNYEKN